MTHDASLRTETISPADRYLPLLALLFIGSGCAALIYEIVWYQLLSLIIGSSAISLGVLLATFMGGMCIGSIGLARVVSASEHPLRVYALLEAGIGAFGLILAKKTAYEASDAADEIGPGEDEPATRHAMPRSESSPSKYPTSIIRKYTPGAILGRPYGPW